MADFIYIALTLIFLALGWGFILICEKLLEQKI